MYEEHIRAAARSMAENMQRSPVPMYGKGLRLPDKGAVIGLLKEIRRLVFPAYYGDPELMTLPVEDYTALLLERIEGQLARQIALALPEEQEQRASVLAREGVEALPGRGYRYDETRLTLTEEGGGTAYTFGMPLEVVCAAADPATGQIDFVLPGGQLAPRPTRPAERREEMPPRRGKDRRAMHVPKGRKGRKKR